MFNDVVPSGPKQKRKIGKQELGQNLDEIKNERLSVESLLHITFDVVRV